MSDELETIKTVAETTGKGIDAAREFGGFIAKYISGPIEEGIGIFHDKLKYLRWKNQVKIIKKTEKFSKEMGIPYPDKVIEPKYAIPLLQAASLEEDDNLQDMWAKLLINCSNTRSNIELKRIYIDILERLNSFEAQILNTIYTYPYEDLFDKQIISTELPEKLVFREENDNKKYEVNENLLLSIYNLEKSGCIEIETGFWNSKKYPEYIRANKLGKSFIKACTLQKNI